MNRLIDEHGRDLGEIVETSGKDSGDDETLLYEVYVMERPVSDEELLRQAARAYTYQQRAVAALTWVPTAIKIFPFEDLDEASKQVWVGTVRALMFGTEEEDVSAT
jgi:hypothetical protein